MILQVRRLTTGTSGAHGNTADTYADPVDWDVYGVAPGAMDEPGQANRDLSMVAWTVLAPKSEAVPTERDRVVFNGAEYDVTGAPKDYTYGPWAHPTAGVTVELMRAEG